ncbi:MAG TPA: hypothetical protein VNJ07_14550 [Chitinophagales bacterium]|nr:hypothetical protein [Chitinophagales bacterium]
MTGNITLLTISLLLCSTISIAQKDLKPEEVEVVKDYAPNLADAVKINFPATIPDRTKAGKLELIYSTPGKVLELPFEPAPLKPLAIAKEKPEHFPMNYFKLGFGTQFSPLFEALWNDGKYEKYNYGFFARHFSSRGVKIDHQDYSENRISVYGNYFTGKARINSELSYLREGVRYYGYNHDTISFEKNDVKQHFNNFKWTTGIANIKSKNAFEYDVRFGYGYFADKNKIRESNPWLTISASKVFRKRHYVFLKLAEDYSRFTNGSSANRNIFTVKPLYEFNDFMWRIYGGIGLTWENNIFHVFPEVGFERSLYDQYIIMYSRYYLELNRTSYQSLTDENPWLGKNFELRNTWFEDRYNGGFRGTVKDFSYDLRLGQKLVRRFPLFINDSTDMRKFNVIYDKLTTILNFHAELFYHISQDWNMSATLEYNHYEMKEVEQPWHLPNFVFDFNTQYFIKKKVYLTLDILARDGVKAKVPVSDNASGEVNLKGTLDVNLGAVYKYNPHFSFFIRLNNLASFKYQKYYRYPSYGFNAMIGATFTY